MASSSSTKIVIYAALAGNLLVAVTKSGAAVWTGSSAMLSEAVHSFVDTGNEILLLYGMRRASRHPDPEHPLGYGRELYFWSFIVALLIFALGAGVSIYQGILHVRQPEPVSDPLVSYVVLALAFLFEGSSWVGPRLYDAWCSTCHRHRGRGAFTAACFDASQARAPGATLWLADLTDKTLKRLW